ncbi:MAG: amylo-alpha-1,6-glucosidase [Candidatus Dormibacteria bacterium]
MTETNKTPPLQSGARARSHSTRAGGTATAGQVKKPSAHTRSAAGKSSAAARAGRLFHHDASTRHSDLGESLITKVNGLFSLCARSGDIDSDENDAHGLYFHDTRFLSRARLRLNGLPLAVLLCRAEGATFTAELSNCELTNRDGAVVPKNRIGINRRREVGAKTIERLEVVNYSSESVALSLSLEFDAAFESMFVLRGAESGKRGTLHLPQWSSHTLTFRYDGADRRTRFTRLSFEPDPTHEHRAGAEFKLQLEPNERAVIAVTIEIEDRGPGNLEPRPLAQLEDWPLRSVSVETDNPLFDRVLRRSFDDLRMLLMRERREIFFAAGVPWFVALFGRDSIITALEMLPYNSAIAASTLILLAHHQGKRRDAWRDEDRGKILHELRVGEMADLHEVPQTPYYGTVDATPLFIILLADYIRWTGDLGLWRRLRKNVDRALGWIDKYGDHDGDGFTDYQSESGKGMANHGWKDSGNSIRNRNGSLGVPPIAPVEVQGYVYRAWLDAAWLLRQEGEDERAQQLEAQAAALRARFRDAYWMPGDKYLALALEADGRRVESITSNPGQAMWGGIVDADHAEWVVRRLLSEAMFNGWGIRTLADSEVAYNPIDYQVGSVWPHDNAMIVAGLKRYGYEHEALQVVTGIFEAACKFPEARLPELFAGFARDQYGVPVRYPVACNPQAWAAGAVPYMLQSVLGLVPDATRGELRIVRPSLPDWLPTVTVRDLEVGGAKIDLRYERHADATEVEILDQRGDISVRIEA